MKRVMRVTVLSVLAIGALVGVLRAHSNIDPASRRAWSEHLGWTDWREAEGGAAGVEVSPTHLSGLVWSEQAGWINLGDGMPANGVHYSNTTGLDFGVNLEDDGGAYGLAWGEHIGWVNFDTSGLGTERARFDGCHRRFRGYIWGENVGWISLDSDIAGQFVAVGPCGFGDFHCDGGVALPDFAAFAIYLQGPGVASPCPVFDDDGDDDVDLKDVVAFQRTFTGS